MPRLKPLSEQVIVITGASSGIGLATARMAAAAGAKLVLAARNGEALRAIAAEISRAGGQALPVEADVARRQDMEDLAAAAATHFGGFDSWVNNAGVAIIGRLDEVSEDDSRRLFDTNFWGTVNGSLAALPGLKARGGALINIGSMVSDAPSPLQGMYVASKHAIKGFTDSLRLELEAEKAPVSVTLIKPGAIATPILDHARNYTDQEISLPPPLYRPEDVARAILHAATHPVRDLFVGSAARLASSLAQTTPRLFDRLVERLGIKAVLTGVPKQAHADNLQQPGFGGQARGDPRGRVVRPSLYTRAVIHPALTMSVLIAGGLAATLLLQRQASR